MVCRQEEARRTRRPSSLLLKGGFHPFSSLSSETNVPEVNFSGERLILKSNKNRLIYVAGQRDTGRH